MKIFKIGEILIILKIIIAVHGESVIHPPWMYKNVHKFIGDFHKVLEFESKNGAYSAFGTWLLLSMTYHGTADKTTSLFNPLIGYTQESRQTISKAQRKFIKEFKGDSISGLMWINKIYLANDITIKPDFNRIIKSIYQSTAKNINFFNPINASRTINKQIEQESVSSFSQVVFSDDFNRKTKLVLVNAIQFTGNWKFPFDVSKTTKRSFQLGRGKKINVPTMSGTFMCEAGLLKNISAHYVVLDFESDDDDYDDDIYQYDKDEDDDNNNNSDKMIIIYPTSSSTLESIEKKLQDERLGSIQNWKNKQKQKCHVHFPKFKIETNWNLEEPIKDIGLKNIFTNNANFNRMTDEFVSVDKILQNVKIIVNEKGCSSSISSLMEDDDDDSNESSTMLRKKSYNVQVDRPFLIFIIKKNVIILSARVIKPCFC